MIVSTLDDIKKLYYVSNTIDSITVVERLGDKDSPSRSVNHTINTKLFQEMLSSYLHAYSILK